MTPSSECSATEKVSQIDDLILPDAPDFISFPPLIPLSLMCKYIKMFRTSFPNSLPTEEERLRDKVNVEFKFLD